MHFIILMIFSDSAYRIPLADAGLLKIPVHPIGYDDARALLE